MRDKHGSHEFVCNGPYWAVLRKEKVQRIASSLFGVGGRESRKFNLAQQLILTEVGLGSAEAAFTGPISIVNIHIPSSDKHRKKPQDVVYALSKATVNSKNITNCCIVCGDINVKARTEMADALRMAAGGASAWRYWQAAALTHGDHIVYASEVERSAGDLGPQLHAFHIKPHHAIGERGPGGGAT